MPPPRPIAATHALCVETRRAAGLRPGNPGGRGARCRLVYAIYPDQLRHIDFGTRGDALTYLAAHNPRTTPLRTRRFLPIQTLDRPPELPTGHHPEVACAF